MAPSVTEASSSVSLSAPILNTVELVDIGVDPKEAYNRGFVDINFFASMALPEVFIFSLPNFYVTTWQILINRKPEDVGRIIRFALGLPRGHAKTTFIKLLISWLIVYDYIEFCLIICANEDLAEQLLADVSDILGSENMEAIYGPWTAFLATDTKELKKAAYHNKSIVLAAKGAGSSLRGLNIKHKRPDFIFLDDAQTRENDESPTESARFLRWLIATLFKVIAPRGNRWIVYVGNMYSEECVLKKLQDNPGWISLITGAILDTGEPLWPELHSLETLMESFYHDEALGHADLWFAEIMNDPKSAAVSLLHDGLPACPYKAEGLVPDGVFITIDPAGFRDNSDDNVIVVHYVHEGKGLVAQTTRGILKPDELIKEALSLALYHGASLIGVEDVGYQQTLQFWINHFMIEFQITGIAVVGLSPHGRSKEARIKQFVHELYAGNYYHLTPATRADFVWQAQKYKIGAKKNKDDLLDAEAYGLDVRNEYWHLVTNLRTKGITQIEGAHVVAANTPISFIGRKAG
jgi:hypothetical protein